MTYHFARKVLGSRIDISDLQKTYETLTTNLGKILRSFENRAPGLQNQILFVYAERSALLKCSCLTVHTSRLYVMAVLCCLRRRWLCWWYWCLSTVIASQLTFCCVELTDTWKCSEKLKNNMKNVEVMCDHTQELMEGVSLLSLPFLLPPQISPTLFLPFPSSPLPLEVGPP